MRFARFAKTLLPLAIAVSVPPISARYALRTMGVSTVTHLTKKQPDMRAKMSDPAANVWGMERINKDNDQELAEYYASLVDDKGENE
jgi:hypothetical protein